MLSNIIIGTAAVAIGGTKLQLLEVWTWTSISLCHLWEGGV